MQPDNAGPDPKDFQFRSRERIAEDLGVGVDRADADVIAQFRRRWRWIACVQVVVIASVTGWVLFTQYRPGLEIPVPTYMMCLLMMAGGGITFGLTALVDFDPDRHPRKGVVSLVENLQFAPVAGLAGWGAGMALFWQFLQGWDPGMAAFLVVNPLGAYFLTLGTSLLAMPLIVAPLAEMVASLRRDGSQRDS